MFWRVESTCEGMPGRLSSCGLCPQGSKKPPAGLHWEHQMVWNCPTPPCSGSGWEVPAEGAKQEAATALPDGELG